jgi:Pyridoxamine 5'-phosphate oxidase
LLRVKDRLPVFCLDWAVEAPVKSIPDTLREILNHEGIVAIATHDVKEAHLVNTWNTYLTVTQDGRLLFPAGGMNVTERNLGKDNRVQMTVGSREVKGLRGPGAGYLIRGTASFLASGPDFLAVKGKFPWARAAVEVQVASAAQTL